MELSILIIQEIFSMFLMIIVGYCLVRLNIIPKETGSYLSKIVMYVVLPCTIVNAFQIEFSIEILSGLTFAFIVSVMANTILVFFPYSFRKKLKLSSVEQASLSYPNSGEILMPLVASVLSKEMQIYCCAFVIVQIVYIFTQGVSLISEERRINYINIVKNVNVIAMIFSFFLFMLNIKIPNLLSNTINSFSGMIAPICMLVIGISIGDVNLKESFLNKRIYFICFIKLIVIPLFFLLLMMVTNMAYVNDSSKQILLIVFMAISSSPAATVVSIASSYNKDVESASVLNITSTVLLIISFPIMITLYVALI